MEKEYRLEDWKTEETSFDPNKPKDQYDCRIDGKVYNHPKFKDGTYIYTSRLIGVEGDMVHASNGNFFILGKPNKTAKKQSEVILKKFFKNFNME